MNPDLLTRAPDLAFFIWSVGYVLNNGSRTGLKRQCQEIVNVFFLTKHSSRAPYEQAKKVLRKF